MPVFIPLFTFAHHTLNMFFNLLNKLRKVNYTFIIRYLYSFYGYYTKKVFTFKVKIREFVGRAILIVK